MAISTGTFLLVVSAIIFVGFAGNWLLNRKGIPQTLFLIAAGAAIRWFGVLPAPTINDLLPLMSQVTLAMVVFDIGMSMRVKEVVLEGRSAVLRSAFYMILSIVLMTLMLTLVFRWDLYQALFLGSIVGGEVSMVVVPYLAKRLSPSGIIANLALESVFDSLVLIILFFVLLNGYMQNAPLDLQGLSSISVSFFSQLSIGSVGGVLYALVWLRIAKYAGQSEYFYIATVGFVFLAFVSVAQVGGSGVMAVLAIGLILKNFGGLPSWLGLSASLPATSLNYITAFQAEISFFLRTFFLFFLGFSVQVGSLMSAQIYIISLAIIGILVTTRYISTEAVDGKKSPRERRFIETMMAQGLTPALLATTLVANSVAGSDEILPIATLVIVATNMISAVGVRLFLGAEEGFDIESLRKTAPLASELSSMTEGLSPEQMEKWSTKIEEDARKAAPSDVKDRVVLPRTFLEAGTEVGKEVKLSRSAVPYLIEGIERNKNSMPRGARAYFEALEERMANEIRDK